MRKKSNSVRLASDTGLVRISKAEKNPVIKVTWNNAVHNIYPFKSDTEADAFVRGMLEVCERCNLNVIEDIIYSGGKASLPSLRKRKRPIRHPRAGK